MSALAKELLPNNLKILENRNRLLALMQGQFIKIPLT